MDFTSINNRMILFGKIRNKRIRSPTIILRASLQLKYTRKSKVQEANH